MEWPTWTGYEGKLRPAVHAPRWQKGVTVLRSVTVSLKKRSERMRSKRVKLQWTLWATEELVQVEWRNLSNTNVTWHLAWTCKTCLFLLSFFTGPPAVPPIASEDNLAKPRAWLRPAVHAPRWQKGVTVLRSVTVSLNQIEIRLEQRFSCRSLSSPRSSCL